MAHGTRVIDAELEVGTYLLTRCRGHSKYVRSFLDRSYFYKMKAVINFLRWGGSAPPYPPGWGCAPDPAFLQWHRELNG